MSAVPAAEDPSGLTWQPWTDSLVHSVVMALPWAGSELADSAPADMERLSGEIDKYLAARPAQVSADLRPLLTQAAAVEAAMEVRPWPTVFHVFGQTPLSSVKMCV